MVVFEKNNAWPISVIAVWAPSTYLCVMMGTFLASKMNK